MTIDGHVLAATTATGKQVSAAHVVRPHRSTSSSAEIRSKFCRNIWAFHGMALSAAELKPQDHVLGGFAAFSRRCTIGK